MPPPPTDNEFRQMLHIRAEFAVEMMEVMVSLKGCLADAKSIERRMRQRMDEAQLLEEGAPRAPRLPVETFEPEGNLARQVDALTSKMEAMAEAVKAEEKKDEDDEWAAKGRMRVALHSALAMSVPSFEDMQFKADRVAFLCAATMDRTPEATRFVPKEKQRVYAETVLKLTGLPNPLPEGWHKLQANTASSA